MSLARRAAATRIPIENIRAANGGWDVGEIRRVDFRKDEDVSGIDGLNIHDGQHIASLFNDADGQLAADEIAMPLLGLSDSTVRRPFEMHLQSLVAHLVYGAAAEMTRRAVHAYFAGAPSQA